MRSTPTLESVISPHNAEDFFRDYWGKRCLHVQRETTDYFNFVLTANDLDHYFQSKTLHPSFIRVIKSGLDCETSKWTRVDKRQNTDFYTVVDTEKLFAHFSAGASLIVNVSEGSIPSVGRFCNSLEQELKIRLQANVYVTPPHEKGFVLHFDSHHIFILQTGGRKRWKLYGRVPDEILAGQQNLSEYYKTREPEEEFELQAGDLLYLPVNTVHEVYTTDSMSIHVSVGIYERRWFHLLQDLSKTAESSFDFNRTLPNSFSSDDDKRKFADEFSEKLKELLRKTDDQEVVANERAVFVRDQFINADGWLLDLLHVDQLNLDSVVSRRPGIDYIVTENARNIEITFWNQKLSIPRILKPVVELISGDEPFRIHEIKGLISDSGKIDLVTDFVRSGLLTIRSL